LITGETGVGKELVARAVHRLSGRDGDFVAVNVAGLDDLMFSDTLFGHKRGAFTGAEQTRQGMVARASSGTLFLDEIGDLNPASQVKLLRLLQEAEFYPLGSDAAVVSRARIIVATNLDLGRMIEEGRFRRDLFYRLNVHQVRIPSLRERSDDIPLLLEFFLDEAARTFSKRKPAYPPELLSYLSGYHFPGNVRELQALVYDAVARHQGGVLSLAVFREAIGRGTSSGSNLAVGSGRPGLHLGPADRFPTLQEAEEFLVTEALDRADGNQGAAASLLGISRHALNKRLCRKQSK
jgi:DNA-binding NtrC family response regulator